MQARSCCLRLHAHARLGCTDAAALATARQLADEALACDAGGRVMPALDRLALLRARHEVAVLTGERQLAQALAQEVSTTKARLTASLGRHAHLAPALEE